MNVKVRGPMALALPVILYLVAVVAFVKGRAARCGFPLDDAWIHQVYARAFACGQGFAYNAGQQEAGATSPLWAIVTAPAHWLEGLGTDAVVMAVKAIGVILGLVCVWLTQRIASRLSGSPLSGGVAACLVALEPKLLFSALSGMETLLLVAVLLGACLLLMRQRPFGFLALLGLAPTVRPEALILLPFAVLGLVRLWRTHAGLRTLAAAGLVAILPMALWVGFCLYATGHPLPNTFYVKAQPFALGAAGVRVGWAAITAYGLVPPWLFPAGLVAFCLLCRKSGLAALPAFLLLMVAPLAYGLGVVGSRHVTLEGYYWTRWLDPAALLLTVAFGIGGATVLTAALADRTVPGGANRNRLLASVSAVVCLCLSVPTFANAYINRRDQLASDARAIDRLNVGMGNWVREHTPADATVAVNDAGAIRYFGQRHTIDLMGLNSAPIAFGKVSMREALAGADWLAVFPLWFKASGLLDHILEDFEPRHTIQIPLAEYTICRAPSQTIKVAFQRKTPRLPADRAAAEAGP